MKLMNWFGAAVLSFSMTSCAHARDVSEPPNIVVIFLDDSGYGDFAHTGNPTIETPNISRLANNGVSFTQFYVPSPACSASRYSLLTGRSPARSGLVSAAIGPRSQRYLHPNEVTIAEGLKTAGYKTAIFGKWHLGNPNTFNSMAPDSLPLAHGFDEWLGTNVSHDYNDAKLLKSDPSSAQPIQGYNELARNLPSDAAVSRSLTKRYTEAALEFIDANKDEQFFIYLAYNQPHLGLYADQSFEGRSRRGLLGDVMLELDDSVGRIIQALELHDLAEDTLVIFSSDNGPWIRFQETTDHPKYGEARMHVGYALPFRDGKGSNWEGGHRVPGIFYWPGTIEPNPYAQEPASTLDILPTIFGLVGVSIPNDRTLDGRDLRSLLVPGHQLEPMPEFRLLYTGIRNQVGGMRAGPWKVLMNLYSQTGDTYGFEWPRKNPLLFQVEQDLGERFNRANDNSQRMLEMTKEMELRTEQIHEEGSYWDTQE